MWVNLCSVKGLQGSICHMGNVSGSKQKTVPILTEKVHKHKILKRIIRKTVPIPCSVKSCILWGKKIRIIEFQNGKNTRFHLTHPAFSEDEKKLRI